ncbi:MAG: (5-formylfuran-3-yl)methyl phosphate synthase [Pirellulaceae bacterium]|jgi:uncharacterized protein (UPF0264 family)|nr:(5-formylfuran-3-yl)methyl phosphate synthase [Pirellulaceae bacterium]
MELLVSVRDLQEAEKAAAGGADIIDLKEPDHGSLGAVSSPIASSIGQRMAHRLPLSLAMGELLERQSEAEPAVHVLKKFTFAKVGLSGCHALSDWKNRWQNWASLLPSKTQPVVVAYADHGACQAPPPGELVDFTIQSGRKVFLIDTYEKNGRIIFDHISCTELGKLFRTLQKYSVCVALAGSIGLESLPQAFQTSPNILAVRGAVCQKSDRNSRLCPDRVTNFKSRLKTPVFLASE